MKKKILVSVLFLILCFMILIPTKVFSASNDYTIEKYKINMIVNENNTFDITEEITVYFNVAKHGIFRKIPLKNSVKREDGTTSKNRAKISDISVNANYKTSTEDGYKVIKIGDSNKTLMGKKTYRISYTYDIGKDPLEDADELYFNLIGTEWDTSIAKVEFNIKMPKSFDKELLGFSTGKYGTSGSNYVTFSVHGTTISGSTTKTLYPGEALTMRLSLPEEYFVGENLGNVGFVIFVLIACIICIGVAFLLWLRYGKDNMVVETVEFYPPEEYNSAEVGYLYNGKATNEAVISLLIYLANKGYLKIEEEEEEGIFNKTKTFRIIKLKEYDGNNEYERKFFNGLFDTSSIVTKTELTNTFYVTLGNIKKSLNSKENKNKIFEKVAGGKTKYLILMIIAIFVIITLKPLIECGGFVLSIIGLIFPGIAITVVASTFSSRTDGISKVFVLIWASFFGGIPFFTMLFPVIIEDPNNLIAYLIGIVGIIILLVFTKIMPKRTAYGNEILGKLRGFKRFLETAEKPQLEELVEKTPEYFYNILPYTYALGVSDKWMKQFEAIAIEAPDWYDSHTAFNIHTFNTFMANTMTSATTAMVSTPSSSGSGGGGGFSGGGFSGGGSGGGGGGSW